MAPAECATYVLDMAHRDRRRLAVVSVVAAASTLAVACTTERPSAPSSSRATSPPSEPGPTSPSAEPELTAGRGPVTIAVAGDIHFEGGLRDRLADPGRALASLAESLSSSDVTIVNLETAIGTGGRPDPTKRFTFQAPGTALTALATAGVDVATMANNHALDFGRDQLPQTMRTIDAARAREPRIDVVGIGRDIDEAFRPARLTVNGAVVAVLGASVADADPTADPTGQWAATSTTPGIADAMDATRLLQAVHRARLAADVVVVYMHWGIQGEQCPSAGQRSLATRLVAAGADVVAGSHAHLLQGDVPLSDGYVAYGLGNFVWYSPTPESSFTGLLRLTVQPGTSPGQRATVTSADWEPGFIDSGGLPRPVRDSDRDAFQRQLESLRACAQPGGT